MHFKFFVAFWNAVSTYTWAEASNRGLHLTLDPSFDPFDPSLKHESNEFVLDISQFHSRNTEIQVKVGKL